VLDVLRPGDDRRPRELMIEQRSALTQHSALRL
jgi:hypothetical protein